MASSGGSEGKVSTVKIRISDVHIPDILPVLGIPILSAPPRSAHEVESVNGAALEKPSAATLETVIKMLNEADIKQLRPLEQPKLRPDSATPLILQVQAQAPGALVLKTGDLQPRRSVKRSSEAMAQATPPHDTPPSADQARVPATASAERANKRPRASLKLTIATADKATLAPTLAEETATLAKALVDALKEFCRSHPDLLAAQQGEAEDMEQDEPEEGAAAGEEDGNEEEDGGGKKPKDAGAHQSSAEHRLLADVRRVSDVAVRACGVAAAMRQVPRETLSRALRALRAATDRGRHVLLEEGDVEESSHVVVAMVALEAAVVVLRFSVGAAAVADAHVVSEEAVQAAIEASRFQLQHNILPFNDARLRSATRPQLGAAPPSDEEEENANAAGPSTKPAEGRGGKGGRGKSSGGGRGGGKAVQKVGLQIPRAVLAISDRVQAVLSLLCDLLPAVKVPAAMLIPLLRSAVATLTVRSLASLQVKSVSLMAAAFRTHADLRRTILDDLFTHAAPFLGSGHSLRREFALGGGSSAGIQMFTAAVMQMVQGAADMPRGDATPAEVIAAYGTAMKAADYFWSQCLEKLPSARAIKAETDQDLVGLVHGVVADLLEASALPEWPAASAMLLRLAGSINSQRGLQHTDPAVRQFCVELLGRLLSSIHAVKAAARADAEWLEGVAADNGFGDVQHAAEELLLKYLADRQHAATPASALARRFWIVRTLSETAAAAATAVDLEGPSAAEQEQMSAALMEARKKSDELDASVVETGLDADEATRLMRPLLHAAFEPAAPAMLSWLLEMLDPRAQAPTTRAKTVKALADVASTDSAVLSMPSVQAAVERSLGDEAISVRDAALTLLGRHMVDDPELALQLLDTVIKAVDDPGASVRKAAIKILRDAAIIVPGFPRATDAACALLPKASDSEESVQNAVAKVFHSLWFGDGGATAERAQQLADVAEATYDAGGASIHLPLDSQHPLVSVLRAALAHEARGDLTTEWRAGRQVAEALLESILSHQQQQQPQNAHNGGAADGSDDNASRPALLALHALAVTDADFCLPETDPQRFLRALAPYLKATPDSKDAPEMDRRCAAERMLCVLSVVESVLSQISHLDDSLGALNDVPGDLVDLINKHRYTQVVAAASKCLAALAERSPAAGTRLVQVAQVYWGWLQNPVGHSLGNLPRFLFILGQLCRHGADIIQRAAAAAAAGGGPPPGTTRITVPQCLQLFTKYWKFSGGTQQLRELVQKCALEATGQLAIARPLTMVEAGSDARAMWDRALKSYASPAFKIAALGSLTELLQADAENLEHRQKAQMQAATTTPTKRRGKSGGAAGGTTLKKGPPAAASAAAAAAAAVAVATENGEGDSLSQSSAVLQQHWEAVLELATDPGARSVADGLAVRRRVMALIDVVVRDGLVGPWTAVPALVALASDVHVDVSKRALRVLAELAEKFPQYVDAGRLIAGLEQASLLHSGGGGGGGVSPQKQVQRLKGGAPPPAAALAALGNMYARLVWPSRPRRNEFLRALLRQFRAPLAGRAANSRPPPLRLMNFTAAVAASLPLRRAEEACVLIQEAAGVCASHSHAVLVELQALLGDEDDDDRQGPAAAAANNPAALEAPCLAAAALCMLHRLRTRLELCYGISAERAAAFAAAGKKKTAEESTNIVADPSAPPLKLEDLDVVGAVSEAVARRLYRELEELHGCGD